MSKLFSILHNLKLNLTSQAQRHHEPGWAQMTTMSKGPLFFLITLMNNHFNYTADAF